MINIRLQPTPELERLAKKYVWWESTDWALSHPDIFLSNAMNLADWDSMQLLRQCITDEQLKQVLDNKITGQFSQRSWDYWHYVLGYDTVPPLPSKRFL